MTDAGYFDVWTLGIAAYAAIISTFVLGWDAYKWLASGPQLAVSAAMNMRILGGPKPDDKSYVSVTAQNVGDQPTTITNLGGMYYGSWWQAYLRRNKPAAAFIVAAPSDSQRIPFRFDVGDQWIGLLEQDEKIEDWAKSGYLFLIVYISRAGGGHRVRIQYREKPTQV